MSLSISEIEALAADLPLALSAYSSLKSAISALKPGATFSQDVVAFGVPTTSPIYQLAQLADAVKSQLATAPVAPAPTPGGSPNVGTSGSPKPGA